MIFREFRETDIMDVSEIFRLIYDDERKPEDYKRWLEYPNHCKNLVVEKDGKVIGRLLLDQFYLYYPELVNFAIHPKYQGKGMGQEIVKLAVTKSLEVKQDSLIIPILKNDYTDGKVKEFYKKASFISVIEGNKDLNEWRMNFQNYSLVKDLLSSPNSGELTTSSIMTTPSPYFRRNYDFNTENKEDMIKHIHLCRSKNIISFKNKANEKAIFTIVGQPDQPIGQIDGQYCVSGLFPAINGVELSNTQCKIKIHFRNVKEIGECDLFCRNEGTSEIIFDLELESLPNVKIRGVPDKLKLNSNEEIDYKIKINLGEKFNQNIFDYTSFETIPITIVLRSEGKVVPPFQITINFWYHLLSKS